MTDELRKRMESLRSIAPKLNKASDTAATVIAKVEDFLGNLHVGIEGRSDWYDEQPVLLAFDDDPQVLRSRLAYGRINGKYAIHVVREQWTKLEPEDLVSEQQVSWSSVGRQEKLEAFATIESLLDDVDRNAKVVERNASLASVKMTAMLDTLAEDQNDIEDDDNDTGVIYRPARPKNIKWATWNQYTGFYLVVSQVNDVVFAYHRFYYPTPADVVDDVIARSVDGKISSRTDREKEFTNTDFTVWTIENRLVAAVYQDWESEEGNLIKTIVDVEPWQDTDRTARGYGLPTRDEWLADGADKIILRDPL